jgi:hypothetical protein
MRNVAWSSIVGSAFEIRVADVTAVEHCKLGTHRIPSEVAAGGVVIADVLAAVLVIAGWGAIREAAVAGFRVATYRHGAGVVGASAVVVGQCHSGTDQVPFGIAAVGVQGTDCIAA